MKGLVQFIHEAINVKSYDGDAFIEVPFGEFIDLLGTSMGYDMKDESLDLDDFCYDVSKKLNIKDTEGDKLKWDDFKLKYNNLGKNTCYIRVFNKKLNKYILPKDSNKGSGDYEYDFYLTKNKIDPKKFVKDSRFDNHYKFTYSKYIF